VICVIRISHFTFAVNEYNCVRQIAWRKSVKRWTVNSATTFDRVVENLGLSPEDYLASSALKEWVRLNKDEKYVPPDLLEAWGFSEDEAA
jgi:hypothetical protein